MRRAETIAAVAVCLILLNIAPALSAVVFVKTLGTNVNDGSSWDLAKQTVQAGIDATAFGGGGEVWVAAGTYKERIVLKPGVAVYGGFSGNETDRIQRNWLVNISKLDASKKGSVVTIATGSDPSVIIDGFTITNGLGANGGGIASFNSSPTISNNRITTNTATVDGGGIYCDGDSNAAVITNNVILTNSAPSGGGIACYGTGTAGIARNTISSNKATTGSGGGLLLSIQGGSLSNNTIRLNTAATLGGGIYCVQYVPITNNLISNNTAADGGGVASEATIDLINNTIADNKAVIVDPNGTPTPGDGGGVYMSADANINLLGNILAFNSPGVFIEGPTPPNMSQDCLFGNIGYDYAGPSVLTSAVTKDPLFISHTTGNYHLFAASPCIDAGDSTAQAGSQDLDGNIRVYDAAIDVGAYEWQPSPPVNASISPSTGTLPIGKKFTITTKYTDNDGPSDITAFYLLLNTSLSEVNGVSLRYDPKLNLLYIRNDAGTSWTGARVPGSGWTMGNSQVVVYCSGTSVSKSGTTVTIKWQLVLRPPTAGLNYLAWLQCVDSFGLSDPYEQKANLVVSSDVVHEPTNVSLTPHSGQLPVETKITFTAVYSDGDGAADLAGAHLLLSPDGTLVNAGYTKWDFNTGKIYLKNDTATSWMGGYLAGSANVIQNSYCKLYVADTNMIVSGNTVTVNWVMSIKSAKLGASALQYLLTWDDGGLFADWKKMGTVSWVPSAGNNYPVNVSLTPNSGSLQTGTKIPFTAVYSDPDGYANLANCYLLINNQLSEAYAADFRYDANANKLYVKSDSGSSWLGGFAPGSANVIENTYGKLYCEDTTVSGSGNSLTVTYAIELKPIIAGGTGFSWIQAVDDFGAKASWVKVGTYSLL